MYPFDISRLGKMYPNLKALCGIWDSRYRFFLFSSFYFFFEPAGYLPPQEES
jgi:hypothetical protein